MMKLPVAFLLLVLALNASAHPWYHNIRRIGHVNVQSTYVETHQIGDSAPSINTEAPDQKPNEVSHEDDDSSIENSEDNEVGIDENDNDESTDQDQDNEIDDDDDDIYDEDYDEPEPSEEEGEDNDNNSVANANGRQQELFKYVFQALKNEIMYSVFQTKPELRYEVQEIFDKYPVHDFSDGEKVEEALQKILEDIKQLKKSNGIQTSSEEDSSSTEETPVPVPDSDEDEDSESDSSEEPDEESNEISDEDNSTNEEDSDEDSDTDDRRRELFKYVFESLKEDLLNNADPEIRDKIQEIFVKYGEPDYSDGSKVEELYEKILKDIKDYKKSKGIKTSSEEEDSSSNEDGATVVSSTATPDQEDESNEVEVDEDEVSTEKPEQEHESDEDSTSEEDSDEESVDERRKNLFKYVFQSLKQDLLDSAEPEMRKKIQEIFDNYPEPDYSNGDKVEEIYQNIVKDIKAYKKSHGIKTSSEEEDSSSIEGNDSVVSSTTTPHQVSVTTEKAQESTEGGIEEIVPVNGTVVPAQGSEEDSDEDEDSDAEDRKKELFKYVFKTMKKGLLESADPELREKIQEIFDKYGEPDYSDGDKVEELYKKILNDVKAYKKSKGIKTSSEEDDSSYNEV